MNRRTSTTSPTCRSRRRQQCLPAEVNEARDDAIIRNTLRALDAAVLVLGGARDLSDNVPTGVKVIALTVMSYRQDGQIVRLR
jgi:hypothetical protein